METRRVITQLALKEVINTSYQYRGCCVQKRTKLQVPVNENELQQEFEMWLSLGTMYLKEKSVGCR